MTKIALTLLMMGCQDDSSITVQLPNPTPNQSSTVAVEPSPERSLRFELHADAVAAADLDGDGVDNMLFFQDGVLSDQDGVRLEVDGMLHAVARGDIDGDGDEEAVLGFGAGKKARAAVAQVHVIHEDRTEQLWLRDGVRNQISDLDVVDGRIFMSVFGSAKGVEAGWLTAEGFEVADRINMATTQEILGDGHRFVGRLYGDEPRSDGDLQLFLPDGESQQRPSLRGVKSLLLANMDSDPQPELLVGDGWHYQYGLRGEAHLRLLDGPDWTESRTIALLPNSYSINNIERINTEDSSTAALLLTASRNVHLLRRDALGWQDVVVDEITETGNAVVVYLADGPWALVSGEPSTLVPLHP